MLQQAFLSFGTMPGWAHTSTPSATCADGCRGADTPPSSRSTPPQATPYRSQPIGQIHPPASATTRARPKRHGHRRRHQPWQRKSADPSSLSPCLHSPRPSRASLRKLRGRLAAETLPGSVSPTPGPRDCPTPVRKGRRCASTGRKEHTGITQQGDGGGGGSGGGEGGEICTETTLRVYF